MISLQPIRASRFSTACLVAALIAAAADSRAAPINYGDFDGTTVMYTDVTETAQTKTEPLFGGPSLSSDNLEFFPSGSNFSASSTNGSPLRDQTAGQMHFGFMSDPGTGLRAVSINEGGIFSIGGDDTNGAGASAELEVQVVATHVNGVALSNTLVISSSTRFASVLGPNPVIDQPWNLRLDLDFSNALAFLGYNAPGDYISMGEVFITNTLEASSDVGTNASITKAYIEFEPDVVPEPTSLALLALGGLGIVTRRRR